MFRIGDFSKLSQVSIKALRFYDEIDLLKPTYVDRFTGYRYYAPNLLSRLNRILVFKELGFSLEEIALLLAEDLPVSEVREALESKRTELSRRIIQEQARLMQVETWLAQIEREGSVPSYEIILKQVAPQLVASVRDTLGTYDAAAELFAELEFYLKKHNATGQQAAIWHTCAGQNQTIDCEAVVFLNASVPASKRIKVYQLPLSMNACVIHQGTDESVSEAYLAAKSWIKKQGYTINGAKREIYWQGGVAQDGQIGVTEIQYPILRPPSSAATEN
jgi:DNA-binding transcriptional MerR regulator